MPPIIDRTKCVQCGICAQICPLDVIRVKGEKKEIVVKYPYECWHCLACKKECPQGAIHMRYPLSHMMYTMDVPAEEKQ
ncbi:MAG: 4Fe-4S binding protein [Blautia sp.]|nr:4Fe-4S binding protein [Blautia sp.]MDY5032722.1 4Fe-4S binding protein [Blautia sp.]